MRILSLIFCGTNLIGQQPARTIQCSFVLSSAWMLEESNISLDIGMPDVAHECLSSPISNRPWPTDALEHELVHTSNRSLKTDAQKHVLPKSGPDNLRNPPRDKRKKEPGWPARRTITKPTRGANQLREASTNQKERRPTKMGVNQQKGALTNQKGGQPTK